VKIISYGGGVQSTALLVLACTGELPGVDAALMANVGDDSEHPASLRYVREVAQPWAARHGVPVEVLNKQKRDGTIETLMGRLLREGSRSLPIPVRMADTGAPGNRQCTMDFKIRVISKWLKAHGASAAQPAEVLVGISWDEVERIGNRRMTIPHEVLAYPLVEQRLTRTDCQRIIERAGLPVPPKSSCYFCPYHRPSAFARMRRDEPALFYRAADLEHLLNERRDRLGKDHVYLTRFGKPLADAIREEQPALDFGTGPGETCDEGYCWT
jgi:hypothetical protein